ncbi:hypothetical protein AE06_00700 [Klebsiella variicola]|nr:hypothetical protein AE06_00700 [Klebsiella variicola]
MTNITELTSVQKNANIHRLSRLIAYASNDELRQMAVEVEHYTDQLIEALEKAQGMEAYWKTQCRGITDHCEELQACIAELESHTVKPPVHPTVASENLDDETLQELIEFRRTTFEYHSKEGNKVQTIIHGVTLAALRELQERRKADSEPVAEVVSIYGDHEAFGEREIRPLIGIQQMPYGTKLYRHAQPAPVVPEEATPDSIEILASARRRDHAVFQWDEDQRNAAADSWNACRAATLAAAPQSPGSESATVPGKWIPVSERMPDCWCRTCRPVAINDMRFVVCPDCGNKRCPRANDHRNACTGSNEPGQEGSAYPADPQEVPDGK